MKSFEQLIKEKNPDFKTFAQAVETAKEQLDIVHTPTEAKEDLFVKKDLPQPPISSMVDDFGQPVIAKATSPFETKQTAKKVLNPHQKSLQGYLKQQQRDKVLQKAATLYSSFKKHCAQNNIDHKSFFGVK